MPRCAIILLLFIIWIVSVVFFNEEVRMKMLDFAIDVEQAEQELYRRLAECSNTQSMKAIFEMIATKEQLLLDKLRALKSNPKHYQQELSKPPRSEKFKNRQNVSCELLEQQEVRDDLSSYSYILRTEQLIYNLYTKLKETETDPQAQSLLDLLLHEKRQEIDRISTLYDVARVVH
jgi:rubrerythrin